MNILCDFHHADLWWAMQLLADRLGATLYRPYGMEWYDEGYFKLYSDLRRRDPSRYLAKQYLIDTLFDQKDNPKCEKEIARSSCKIGREIYNGCLDYPAFNTLTLDQARKMQIDIVICTVHENEPYFAKLKEFWPHAKFIRQVGNDLDREIDPFYQNLLSSAMTPYNNFDGHKVLYRQEFRLDIFKHDTPRNFDHIWSFQNDIEQFEDMWIWWSDLKHKMPDYDFKSYGVGCEQGKIYPKRDLVKKMLEATFIPQSKGPWEGYGHTIHNAICLGRPMIVKFSDYEGRMAEPLLLKDQTYLEMDDPELPDKIRYYSVPERYNKMYEKCVQTFNEVIDFDKEFVMLKEFFDNLV